MLHVRYFLIIFLGIFCPWLTAIEEPAAKENVDIQQVADKFYEEYLSKYYPKALTIRSNFFTNKDPDQVAGALKAFIDLLATKPWFYVANQPDGFKLTHYWEFIIDQCSLINTYLKKAYINLDDNLVFLPDRPAYNSAYSYAAVNQKKTKRLLDYLKSSHKDILGAFYAFSFDYVIKLFNEGILLKDSAKATKYFAGLEFIMEKLQNTSYEAEYQEAMETVKKLSALLKHKYRLDNVEVLDRLYGTDEKSKKWAQESMLLNRGY